MLIIDEIEKYFLGLELVFWHLDIWLSSNICLLYLVRNVNHFPILSGMIELDGWTKIVFLSNFVHTNATTKEITNWFLFRVHDCQIEYKLMSHTISLSVYYKSFLCIESIILCSIKLILSKLCFFSLLLQKVSKGDSNLRTLLSYHS